MTATPTLLRKLASQPDGYDSFKQYTKEQVAEQKKAIPKGMAYAIPAAIIGAGIGYASGGKAGMGVYNKLPVALKKTIKWVAKESDLGKYVTPEFKKTKLFKYIHKRIPDVTPTELYDDIKLFFSEPRTKGTIAMSGLLGTAAYQAASHPAGYKAVKEQETSDGYKPSTARQYAVRAGIGEIGQYGGGISGGILGAKLMSKMPDVKSKSKTIQSLNMVKNLVGAAGLGYFGQYVGEAVPEYLISRKLQKHEKIS